MSAFLDPLGALMPLLATCVTLLLALGVAERLVPFMPSSVLFIALGIGAEAGHWHLTDALVLSIAGSLIGGIAFYAVGAAFGTSPRLVRLQSGRFRRLQGARLGMVLDRLRANGAAFTFLTQLLPTVRIVAPTVSGAIGTGLKSFTLAALAGVSLWNASFIGLGYLASSLAWSENASLMATLISCGLAAAGIVGISLWRWLHPTVSKTRCSTK